jgi:Bacterial SH3 domain
MKLAVVSLLYMLGQTHVASGQLAIIKDPDGVTNIRAGAGINAKIIGKFHDGDVFGYDDEKNGWVHVYYNPADSSDSRSLEGYIHKDRLLPIYDLQQIVKNDKSATNGHLTVHKDSLTVELVAAPFRPKQHVLRKDKSGYIEKIDGKRPLGTDGDMPFEKMTSLRVTIGGRAVDIPAAAWDNLYDPTLETCTVFADTRTGFLYISLFNNRSAAGGYEMAWVFKNGEYIRRYVDQTNN